MGDNFLPCARDLRSLLSPTWQDWLPEGVSGLIHPRCDGPEGEYTE